jgi:protein-tyrosine phosphatase/ABC-type Mn2+/Zn2+ transport system ATPase subunit
VTAAGHDVAALFEVDGGSVDGPRGRVLQGMHLVVRERGVTAVLGPGGVGKSLLLRALAGRPPAGFSLGGQWTFRGRPLPTNGFGSHEVAWVAQRPAHRHSQPSQSAPPPPDIAAYEGRALLLDEPNAHLDAAERKVLEGVVRRQGRQRAVVMVTHDLGFAREVADRVVLLAGGSVCCSEDAGRFFDDPPSELARRFIAQGNCWIPGPGAPELPAHFHWLLPKRLAGMGRPGLLREEGLDLESIATAGIELLVSLTTTPVPPAHLRAYGMRGRHFPIADMGVPAVVPTARLCRELERALEQGEGVAIHCRAGLGRTGTLLAAYLVWTGTDAAQAVRTVRAVVPGYLQTEGQVQFIHRFAEAV